MAKGVKRKAARKPARTVGRKTVGKEAVKKRVAERRYVKAKHVGKNAPKPNAAGMVEQRSDFKQPGSVAIDRMPEPQRSIARAADRLIRSVVPDAESMVKWGNACYYSGGRAFAALSENKAGVNLALPGAGLSDPSGLLEGTGKSMRHVKLRDTGLASDDRVAALVRQGVKIGFERM